MSAAGSPGATATSAGAARRLSPIGRLGAATLRTLSEALYFVAVATRVATVSVGKRAWPRTTRNVLARQVFFTGIGALRFSLFLALLVGISVVLQTKLWLERSGQELLFGPLLMAIVVRELAPLLVNIVVLVRSGSAIVTELATMTVTGEVELLESQGVDPLEYLVLPRVVGVIVSVSCLTVFFVVAAFLSGYFASLAIGSREPTEAAVHPLVSILSAVDGRALLHVSAKAVVPAGLTSLICCIDGLGAGTARTDIPKSATRALSRAIAALFVSSIGISIVSYL